MGLWPRSNYFRASSTCASSQPVQENVERAARVAQRRVIDARLAESLEQVKRGDTYGPFDTHEEMTSFLHAEAKKARHKKASSVKSRAR